MKKYVLAAITATIVALGIAGAIILPTLRTVAGFHGELVWPENVTWGHEPGQVG